MQDINRTLEGLRKSFDGFIANIAKSNEVEVVLAVYKYLVEKNGDCPLASPIFKHKVFRVDTPDQVCELDGLLYLGKNNVAIIEVKSRVNKETIDQVQRASSKQQW